MIGYVTNGRIRATLDDDRQWHVKVDGLVRNDMADLLNQRYVDMIHARPETGPRGRAALIHLATVIGGEFHYEGEPPEAGVIY